MTVTEERADREADERADGRPSRGEGLLWFSGGLYAAFMLVIVVGLGVLAVRSDALGDRRAADDPPPAGPETVFLATEFAYDPSAGTGAAGGLTLTLVNEGAVFHNLLIEEVTGLVLETDPGASSSAQLDLDAGVYTLYCSVPGHREAGMEATLTVDAA